MISSGVSLGGGCFDSGGIWLGFSWHRLVESRGMEGRLVGSLRVLPSRGTRTQPRPPNDVRNQDQTTHFAGLPPKTLSRIPPAPTLFSISGRTSGSGDARRRLSYCFGLGVFQIWFNGSWRFSWGGSK
jgi:hypothetical protein